MIYSLALFIALVVSAPWWLVRMATSGRYRNGLRQRLGGVPAALRTVAARGPVVWVHAVSVGEVLAASRLIAELQQALPGWEIVVSTTTQTGQQLAQERMGAERVFYFPFDFAWIVRRYLRALQPKMLVLMESELWPRVLVECERAHVPVVVVNARVSDRSLPRYRLLRLLWRPLLQKLTLLLTQTEQDAQRWISIGAPADRVRVSGNLKYDVRAPQMSELTVLLQKHLPREAKVLVCGSTLPNEEEMLLDCWKTLGSDAVMVVAPRHPERFDAVDRLIAECGFTPVRLSAWRSRPVEITNGSVLLLDSIGDLAALYSLATLAFVGGSLVDSGGHNPLEPAQFGVPVVMGEHYANFRAMVDAMRAADAIRIVSRDDLCGELMR